MEGLTSFAVEKRFRGGMACCGGLLRSLRGRQEKDEESLQVKVKMDPSFRWDDGKSEGGSATSRSLALLGMTKRADGKGDFELPRAACPELVEGLGMTKLGSSLGSTHPCAPSFH
jgi:hypothetical protein